MAEGTKTIWGIHSYDDSLFLKKSILGLGWAVIGDLSAIEPARKALKTRYAEYYGQISKRYQKLIPLKMAHIPIPLENEF